MYYDGGPSLVVKGKCLMPQGGVVMWFCSMYMVVIEMLSIIMLFYVSSQ